MSTPPGQIPCCLCRRNDGRLQRKLTSSTLPGDPPIAKSQPLTPRIVDGATSREARTGRQSSDLEWEPESSLPHVSAVGAIEMVALVEHHTNGSVDRRHAAVSNGTSTPPGLSCRHRRAHNPLTSRLNWEVLGVCWIAGMARCRCRCRAAREPGARGQIQIEGLRVQRGHHVVEAATGQAPSWWPIQPSVLRANSH